MLFEIPAHGNWQNFLLGNNMTPNTTYGVFLHHVLYCSFSRSEDGNGIVAQAKTICTYDINMMKHIKYMCHKYRSHSNEIMCITSAIQEVFYISQRNSNQMA